MNRPVVLLAFALSISFTQYAYTAEMKRILVLGDSLSAGFGLKSSQAWPALVTEKLRDAGLTNFEITNASQTGGTTAGGLQRLPAHLKRKSASRTDSSGGEIDI